MRQQKTRTPRKRNYVRYTSLRVCLLPLTQSQDLFVATAARTCHRLSFDHPQALTQRGSSWSEARFDSVFARLTGVMRPEDTHFAANVRSS